MTARAVNADHRCGSLFHAGASYRAVVVFDANRADSSPVDPRSAYALGSQLFFTDDCPVKGLCVSNIICLM